MEASNLRPGGDPGSSIQLARLFRPSATL